MNYQIKFGDTLRSIAHHQLGDVSRWAEISQLNDLSPVKALSVGKQINLPAKMLGGSRPIPARQILV